jgi:methionine synthase II (cobalamin-independent)
MMVKNFQANALPVLIGSLPMGDHEEAVRLVLAHTPEIPLWVQLPVYKEEGMIFQFMPGLPGFTVEGDKAFINTAGDTFDEDLLKFYEDYMADTEGEMDLYHSRFAMKADTAKGFFTLMEHLSSLPHPPFAVKGQVTGPITFCTAVKNQSGRSVFYDEQLRDAAVKLLGQKARWQVKQLSKFGCPVMIFFDEPALAGFGSSEFISISHEEVAACFEEVIEAVHKEGALAGIHVCANTEWPVILDSSADIVSFDAYSFFDKFILYPKQVKEFIESGRIIAWGIVPTSQPEDIEKETADSLVAQWQEKAEAIEAMGVDKSVILSHSLITPSCGTGSLSLDHATRVLQLTKEVSGQLRKTVR